MGLKDTPNEKAAAAAVADLERSAEGQPLARDGLNTGYGTAGSEGSQPLSSTVSAQELEGSEFCPPGIGHLPHLDITRICCVWIVAVDHGDSRFGRANSLFGQDWVLQYLFLVCGICYGMSKKGLVHYQLRLAMYVLIGVCVNWSTWLLMGKDWKGNFFNVIFQFWFVIGLMMYSILLAPLRSYLASVRKRTRDEPAFGRQLSGEAEDDAERHSQQREHKHTLVQSLVMVGGGVLGLLILFRVVVQPLLYIGAPYIWRFTTQFGKGSQFWSLPRNTEESYLFLDKICTYLLCTCTNVYLVIVCPMVFQRPSLTGWFVLLNTYGNRLVFYRANDERPFHALDLVTIALTVYYLGLLHRRKLGEYIARYWFVVLFVCGLLWPLGAVGRFDEVPPTDLSLRVRVGLLEAVFVVTWLVAGERLVQREIFTEDRLDFMNDWALVVFLVHKAVHLMIPAPMNWAVLLLLAPACYLRRHMP